MRRAGYTRCGTGGVRAGTPRAGAGDVGVDWIEWRPGERWPLPPSGSCATERAPAGRVWIGGPPRSRVESLVGWIRCTADDPRFRAFVLEQCAGGSSVERAASAQRLVQSIPYRDDPADPSGANRDLVRSWRATLDEGEDCDGLSAWVCAADVVLGLGWRLLWIAQPAAALDHVSAEAWCGPGVGWVWQEVTLPARLGEGPYSAAARLERFGGRDGLGR